MPGSLQEAGVENKAKMKSLYSILHFKDIIQYMKMLHISTATKGYCWGHISGCAKIWGYHDSERD